MAGSLDGDDIVIWEWMDGYGYVMGSSLPATITSRTNVVNFVFSTNYVTTKSGWSVTWSAMTPGDCQTIIWIFVVIFFLVNVSFIEVIGQSLFIVCHQGQRARDCSNLTWRAEDQLADCSIPF